MSMKSLEREALSLSSSQRAKLALDLIESLETLAPHEVARLWEQESIRRAEQADKDQVSMIPCGIVEARARDLLG